MATEEQVDAMARALIKTLFAIEEPAYDEWLESHPTPNGSETKAKAKAERIETARRQEQPNPDATSKLLRRRP